MPTFPVSPAKEQELIRRMLAVNLKEEDLEESFIRGSGPGGQKINKTSVAVQLLHRPSGLMVRAQTGRSQAMNRYFARKRLVEKLEEKILGEKSERRQLAEKIRRQKRRRSRRAKEKMLREKKITAEKKQLRKPPTIE